MRKITLLLLLALMATAMHAKDKVTTLWEGTFSTIINLDASNLKEDCVVTVYFTSTGENLKVYYNVIEGSNWNQTALPSLNPNQWFWQNDGVESYSFTLSEDDMTALNSSANGLCFDRGSDKLSITKITLTETLTPSSTTNISTDKYTSDWDGKTFDAVASAKIGDVLKFTYTATGTWFQIYVMNYGKGEDFINSAYSVTKDEEGTYEYVIPDYATLKKIRTEGFSIKGADFQLTSVDLLTYSDSYGYITFTIGDAGYATWSSNKKYDFASAGLTAYYASTVATGTVTLTSKDITWDWQGYIIKGNAGSYDVLESLTTDGSYYPSPNYLKCNVSESTISASTSLTYHYIFAKDATEGVGFYNLAAAHTLAANKAYLETTENITPGTTSRVALIFDDETTAISGVKEHQSAGDGIFYNLNGLRVMQPAKGLYIQNGKKVIIK